MAKSTVKEKFEEMMKVQESVVSEEHKSVITSAIGAIHIKDKTYMLLVGDDNKWYKKEEIGQTRYDEMNNTAETSVWGETTPLTKEEFNLFMNKK